MAAFIFLAIAWWLMMPTFPLMLFIYRRNRKRGLAWSFGIALGSILVTLCILLFILRLYFAGRSIAPQI